MASYSAQRIFHISGYNIDTGALELSLRKMKETGFKVGQDTVFTTGGRSNSKSHAFDHSNSAMISGSSALIDESLMAVQLGSSFNVLTNSTAYEFEEIIEVTTADQVNTKYTATGTAGDEIIGDIQIRDTKTGGTESTKEQASSATAGKFAYTPSTKLIQFESNEVPVGKYVVVRYHPTASTMKQLTKSTDKFSATLRIVADGLFSDENNKEVIGQLIFEKGKISGEFEWNLGADADPAMHNFTCEALEDSNEELFTFNVVDPDNLT